MGVSLADPEPSKVAAVEGRRIWTGAITSFSELLINHRFENESGLMAQVAPLARKGDKIPGALLDALNSRCMLAGEAVEHANTKALWLAATNAECSHINDLMTKRLIDEGALSFPIYAHHKPGRDLLRAGHTHEKLAALRATAALTVDPQKEQRNAGTGMGPTMFRTCIGSRVRVKGNPLVAKALYNGSMGTIVGYGFPEFAVGVNAEKINNSSIEKYRRIRTAQEAASLNLVPPLIFVQIDHAADGGVFESCFADMPGVVCFASEKQSRLANGFERYIPNLMLAFAITYHKAQGMTCKNGVVMQHPLWSQKH